ncbi:MAG: hypothetical protein IKK82_04540 [Kiritimatiellae bacterium]|nr:hypothetical protein [Kiritimatiellia bacterium]
MWPFGKVEWKTAMMPLEFVDDASDQEAMMIAFEAVGNPDGRTRYFSVSYYFPGKKGQTLLYKLYCICLTVGCGMW